MADPPPDRYRLFVPPVQADRLRDMHDREAAAGRKAAFVAALGEVNFRLIHEPADWGESRNLLPVMEVQIRVGTAGPLTVWYGVNEAKRYVYLQRVRLRGDPPEE